MMARMLQTMKCASEKGDQKLGQLARGEIHDSIDAESPVLVADLGLQPGLDDGETPGDAETREGAQECPGQGSTISMCSRMPTVPMAAKKARPGNGQRHRSDGARTSSR